jgi:hypothetical protein
VRDEQERCQSVSDHERTAFALEESARPQANLAILWECTGDHQRAEAERQRAHEAPLRAARERDLAHRAAGGEAGGDADQGPGAGQSVLP